VLLSTTSTGFAPFITATEPPPSVNRSRIFQSVERSSESRSMQRAAAALVSSAWMNGLPPPPSYSV
jgi:hypothetical protein